MEKAVETLIKKAGDAEDSSDAMRFSQAALNAANALLTLYKARDEAGNPLGVKKP